MGRLAALRRLGILDTRLECLVSRFVLFDLDVPAEKTRRETRVLTATADGLGELVFLDGHANLLLVLEQVDRPDLRNPLELTEVSDLQNWRDEEIERSSLMGLWDALAQQAEKLAERVDR